MSCCLSNTVASAARKLSSLSSAEVNILQLELGNTTEDPILVLKLNALWIAAHGQVTADNILDRIAQFGMAGNNRRDSGDGTARWIFHFDYSVDISACRADILANYPNAFAADPALHAQVIMPGLPPVPFNTEPMASAVIIHKMGLRRDDTQSYPFFYMFP
jgi:hypothetical protein